MAKDIDLKKIENKIKGFFIYFKVFLKKRIEGELIIIFLLSVALWGYVFYIYAYKPVFTDPTVSVTTLKIKEGRLKMIMNDIKEREDKRATHEEIKARNPFQDATKNAESSKTATTTTSGQ